MGNPDKSTDEGLDALGVELVRVMRAFAASAQTVTDIEERIADLRKLLDDATTKRDQAEASVRRTQTRLNEAIATSIKRTP